MRCVRVALPFVLAIAAVVLLGEAARAENLKHHDGEPDGKKSLGGSGEMIRFSLPSAEKKIAGIRIHGSRYGRPQAPDESFLVYFLNEDLSDVVETRMAPYSLFNRGAEKWVDVKFARPVSPPETFWIALDFRAHQTKGVYVSFDTSTSGGVSRIGLPGLKARETEFSGDWMVEVVLED